MPPLFSLATGAFKTTCRRLTTSLHSSLFTLHFSLAAGAFTPPELEPPIEPYAFMTTPLLPWWVYLALGVILILAAGLLIRHLRRPKLITPPTQAEIALGELRALQEKVENEPQTSLREIAIASSLILRRYLTGETQDPALYETQQEFNRRTSALSSLPANIQEPTRNFIDELALFKYEPLTSTNSSRSNSIIKQATGLINQIEQSKQAPLPTESDVVIKRSKVTPQKAC